MFLINAFSLYVSEVYLIILILDLRCICSVICTSDRSEKKAKWSSIAGHSARRAAQIACISKDEVMMWVAMEVLECGATHLLCRAAK